MRTSSVLASMLNLAERHSLARSQTVLREVDVGAELDQGCWCPGMHVFSVVLVFSVALLRTHDRERRPQLVLAFRPS